ncbi:Protein STRUBBELIG-RECEPTOR FAMILY 8 [Acorus calamus]|uniref:Protein STRUBBELIG-RECEPTOR FAMILY 8 n=1 Tax=Acorus calamus TaxID=4465 RepID=A0AAV9DA60_ACOCL|nr:Protein STRUBBELIG-RECEPTOR FAMILY 8 [Acorus calamus]
MEHKAELLLQLRLLMGFRFALTLSLLLLPSVVLATTDSSDVQALGVLFGSLNNAPQLTGWKANGGDPCGESWKGISCEGSAVVAIQLPGLGLNGTLGYLLSDLLSLKTLDLSNNNIHDTIPYQLPPNLTYLNFASNNLTGNLPYSITNMASLTYLNASHNSLSQSIGDIFQNHSSLSELDISFNNLSGNLPNSFSSLSNLSSLFLQNNQLTGPVDILSNLDLTNLNIANNHFNGWIPQEFKTIPNLILGGNSFNNGPAPPPPPYVAPPPSGIHNNHNRTGSSAHTPPGPDGQSSHRNHQNDKKNLAIGPLTGIVLGSILVGLCALLFCIIFRKKIFKSKDEAKCNPKDPLVSLPAVTDKGEWSQISDYMSMHAPTEWSSQVREPSSSNGQSVRHQANKKEIQEQMVRSSIFAANLKPPPAEKMIGEKAYSKNGSGRRTKAPITATSYTVASLQTATNSFSQECLVGEGSLGRVYRAEFPNGKIFAIKKIDSAAVSLQEEDNFLEAVSNMSRLRHPNITTLLGYCVEHGQRLLIYEYISNGTLHDMLHYADDNSERLSWNARVKIALGTARAIEYLHEVCLPPVVHRNFKSANILLDEDLTPHLSDCGLAALTPNTERQVSTQMVGSFGYSAPEFAMSGLYTVRSDVYSFGVVMLELLTGRKPLDSSRTRSEQSLVGWATPQLHDIDALAKMVDPALKGMYPAKSLSRFADIIALCVQSEPEFRPPMSEVVQALVRLMQRASIVKRRSGDEPGFSYRIMEHEAAEIPF